MLLLGLFITTDPMLAQCSTSCVWRVYVFFVLIDQHYDSYPLTNHSPPTSPSCPLAYFIYGSTLICKILVSYCFLSFLRILKLYNLVNTNLFSFIGEMA